MKVTRVAYSAGLNAGKWAQLAEQAARLGRVRSQVWQRYGSIAGAGLSDREVRDRWLAEGFAAGFGVLANAWKETVRDAMGDIRAHQEAAKVAVRRAIARHTTDTAERKRLYTALKAGTWTRDAFLSALIAAEDLTSRFAGRNYGRTMNRRLAAWTKGVTAEALANVSERRGSVLVHVNAAYTSQVDPRTGALGARRGEKLYCPSGVVWQADHAAAINVLHRVADPDIGRHTPHTEVKRIVRERTDRHRISTADPGLQRHHERRAKLSKPLLNTEQ